MSLFSDRQFFRRSAQGFTLVELMVVIVIVGIIAGVAIPQFVSLRGEARLARMQAFAGALQSAVSLGQSAWLSKGQPAPLVLPDGATVDFIGTAPSAGTVKNLLSSDMWPDMRTLVLNGSINGGYAYFCYFNEAGTCPLGPGYCAVKYTVNTATTDGYVIDTSNLTLANCAR